MIDAVNILQTISIGILGWAVKTLWAVTITQAEHGEKLEGHGKRIDKLEARR